MEIIWTHAAIQNLKNIHDFYCKTASKEVAVKIIEPLFDLVKSLSNKPKIGQEEEYLKHLEKGHRYLVQKHCKIIYKIDQDTIYITHIFDTRQNPKKLK